MNLQNAPRTAAKFESMVQRRISDMTELWDFAADLERELARVGSERVAFVERDNARLRDKLDTACGFIRTAGRSTLADRLSP